MTRSVAGRSQAVPLDGSDLADPDEARTIRVVGERTAANKREDAASEVVERLTELQRDDLTAEERDAQERELGAMMTDAWAQKPERTDTD
jgi:hypothetical protein